MPTVPMSWDTSYILGGWVFPDAYTATIEGTQSHGYAARTNQDDAKTSGKWYFELETIETQSNNASRLIWSNYFTEANPPTPNITYRDNGSLGGYITLHSSAPAWSDGSVLMFAFDFDDLKLWIGKDGVWSSGDPALGTSPNATITDSFSEFYVSYKRYYNTDVVKLYTGQEAMNYTPPEGFNPGWYQGDAPGGGGGGGGAAGQLIDRVAVRSSDRAPVRSPVRSLT